MLGFLMEKLSEKEQYVWDCLLPVSSRTFDFVLRKMYFEGAVDPARYLAISYEIFRIEDNISDVTDELLNNRAKKFYTHKFVHSLREPPYEQELTNKKLKKWMSFLKNVPTENKGYKKLHDNAEKVVLAYRSFPEEIRKSIYKTANDMAWGFTDGNIKNVRTMKDFHRRCHYDAGIVGILIDKIFTFEGYFPNRESEKRRKIAHDFGVGLQEGNHIKDVVKDYKNGIGPFLPSEIIEKNDLTFERFVNPKNKIDKLKAINVYEELIDDQKKYSARALTYTLDLVREGVPAGPAIFCADADFMTRATMREILNSSYIRGSNQDRKISRKEVKVIDRLVTKFVRTYNKEGLEEFAEHLNEKNAEKFMNKRNFYIKNYSS
jgi:hypothetical protein